MKNLIIFLLFFLPKFSSSQELVSLINDFSNAVHENNNLKVIESGFLLLTYIDDNNYEIDTTVAKIRIYIGESLYNSQQYEEAHIFNQANYDLFNDVFGENSSLALYCKEFTKIIEAKLFLIDQIKKFYEFVDTENDTNVVELGLELVNFFNYNNYEVDSLIIDIRINVGKSLTNIGNYDQAIDLDQDTYKFCKSIWGDFDHRVFNLLINLSQNYYNVSDFNKSLEFNFKLLQIKSELFGLQHIEYSRTLYNVGICYIELKNYLKAIEYIELSKGLFESILGRNTQEVGKCLMSIANSYSQIGNWKESLNNNLSALQVIHAVFGNESEDFSIILNNIALDYADLGDYFNALNYGLKSLKLREKLFGKNSLSYAIALGNISTYHVELGNYNEAYELANRSLELKEEILDDNHPSIITSLINLGYLLSRIGSYEDALVHYFRALSMIHRNKSDLASEYASCLSNMASVYWNLGKYSDAIDYNKQALEIKEKIIGKEHPEYSISLNNLGTVYSDLGDFQKALDYFKESLEIKQSIYGNRHPEYAVIINNIANTYLYLGEYSKALDYNTKALDIFEEYYGVNHSDYMLGLKSLGFTHALMNNFSTSFSCFQNSVRINLDSFFKNRFGLSNQNKLNYKLGLDYNFELLASNSILSGNNPLEVYPIWIAMNGVVGTDNNTLMRIVLNAEDSVLINLFEENKLIQIQLNKFYDLTLGEREEIIGTIKEYETKKQKIETELSKRSSFFSEISRSIRHQDVVNNLQENEVFIDLVRFNFHDFSIGKWTDSVKYLVFITNSKDTLADYLFIHDGKELEDELFGIYHSQVSNPKGEGNVKNEVFFNSFWKPIAEKIGDSKTIYVSLGGVYNRINLNTLYNPETGKYLIEEKDIRIVNSARDFVLMKERLSNESERKSYTSSTSAVYGFPDFSANSSASIDTAANYFAVTRDLDPFWIDSLTRGGLVASSLPATKVEVERIAETFQKNGWKVSSYTGTEASESNIKKEESPRVLHIATHGYFFEDIPLDKAENRFLGMDRQRVVQDPMLRSGLLFAGANKTIQGEELQGENGLLSAAEASLLNLRGTELVVLSACETGRGEVKNSEGVYGLRKAFADAGAKNIIMSLWKVDDKVTQEFMTRFYEIWLSNQTSIREAFNQTQLEIKAKYPQPYYWGAFILVGE